MISHVRNSFSFITLLLTTIRTSVRITLEPSLTDMTNIMDSATRLFERALWSRFWRIGVARIAIRIFIKFSRVPRAYLATHMAAARAFLGAGGKERGAEVTVTVNTLAHRPTDEIPAAGGRRHLQRNFLGGAELEVRGPGE